MRFLDLFAGIGGFSLGLERAGMTCIGHVEIDPYCQKVLKKHWLDVPLIPDIREVIGDEFGPVELVCGGPPCQPVSLAGKRRGEKDDRWLWEEALALVGRIRPAWCLFENPPGIITLGLDRVLSALEDYDYAVQTFEIPACAVGAPHLRQRVWIVAHCDCTRRSESGSGSFLDPGSKPESRSRDFMGDSYFQRLQVHQSLRENNGEELPPAFGAGRWDDYEWIGDRAGYLRRVKSGLCGVAHGIPKRMDRVRCLGNAVMPELVEILGRAIMEANHETRSRYKGIEKPNVL